MLHEEAARAEKAEEFTNNLIDHLEACEIDDIRLHKSIIQKHFYDAIKHAEFITAHTEVTQRQRKPRYGR